MFGKLLIYMRLKFETNIQYTLFYTFKKFILYLEDCSISVHKELLSGYIGELQITLSLVA